MSRPSTDYRRERLLVRLLAPVLTYIDARFDRLEIMMTNAEQTYSDSWARFDEAQRAGFAELSTRLADLTSAAQRSGDDALMRAAARVDAARDGLAAGFAQFRSAPDTPPVDDATIPPVINPETPPASEADPDATDGVPVDAPAVVEDPAVATPNG